ncbi:prephenate dehydratase [Methylohalobius crimeensis]|uniref:prephenate dehydratase n=1 Tax=Methylohalobius crimeensis TaxID=244365 RepID=UPI0003B671B3|nr:prephenate dehydratase [Methylohalobius crimeensis]
MKTGDKLRELRRRIDAIDAELLRLLNERAELALQVAEVKRAAGDDDCFYRPDREAEVLRRIKAKNPGPLDDDVAVRIFREIMSACLALEKPLQVAFLGPEGTFTQQAAYKHFGQAIAALPLPAVDEIFRAVAGGACGYGVVPVENSTEGVVTHTLDSFLNTSLLISGEVVLRIHHNLMSRRAELQAIEEVFSHQQSLAQCREWLDRFLPHAKRTPVSSNAEGARLAAIVPNSAAIAGEVAARLYELDVLESSIEDDPDNTTRFLVIGKQPVGPTGDDKTSLVVSTRNAPGALYRLLQPFADHRISMSKIESRPSRQGMWEYVFFIDIEGHRDDVRVTEALTALEERAQMVKWLGSYPRAVI